MEQKYIDLFDRFTHGAMPRANSWKSLPVLAGSTAAASVLLTKLENNYALAEIVAEDDQRLTIETASFDTGKGQVSGYLVKTKQAEKVPGGDRHSRESRPQSAYQGRDAAHGARRLPCPRASTI